MTEDETAEPAGSAVGQAEDATPVATTKRPLMVVWVLASVSLVLFGAVVWFGVDVFGGWREAHGRSEASAAAEQAAVAFTSFDHNTAQADLDRLKSLTTATFVQGFSNDSGAFLRGLGDNKITVTGKATSTGVADYTADQARVLVAIKAQFSSAQSPAPQERDYRMEITMVHRDGRWLADSAGFVA